MLEQQPSLQLICEFAKQKNVIALKDYINKEISINFMEGLFSPVMFLAVQEEHEAVDFLITQFSASIDHAVFGYALANNKEKVDELIAEGADKKFALYGYALIGSSHVESFPKLELYFDIPNKILSQTNLDEASRKAFLDDELTKEMMSIKVKGCAYRGDKENVEKIISEVSDCFPEYATTIRNDAVFGYALNNHMKEAGELIDLGASNLYALRGHAQAGHVEQVSALIYFGKGDKNEAARCYAMTGKRVQVEKLLSEGANQNIVVEGYAEGGYIKEVNQLLVKGANKNHAIRGYIKGNHLAQANELVVQVGVESAYRQYLSFGSIIKSRIISLLASIDDEKLRVLVLKIYQSKYRPSKEKCDFYWICASQLNGIMREEYCNFNDATILWKRLHKKNTLKRNFKNVCKWAMEKNTEKLQAVINIKFCIDFFDGFYSPVMWLAKQQESEAVDFLINKFGASVDAAIAGYALGGNEDKVNELLAAGGSPLAALKGYAFGGWHNYYAKILPAIKNSTQLLKDEGSWRNILIKAAAFRGEHDRVGCLIDGSLREQSNPLSCHQESLAAAVIGYAMAGNTDKVAERNSTGAFLLSVIKSYVEAGNVVEVDKLLISQNNINSALEYYAMSGNFEQVELLIEKGGDVNRAVQGYACGGYIEKVNGLLKTKKNYEHAIIGYAQGHHIAQINQLAIQNNQVILACNMYAKYSCLINPRNILFLYTATTHLNLRVHLINSFASKHPNSDISLLKQQSNCLETIMKNCQLGFYEARRFLKPEIITWLIQGWTHLVKKNPLIKPEDFYYITSFILALPQEFIQSAAPTVKSYFFSQKESSFSAQRGLKRKASLGHHSMSTGQEESKRGRVHYSKK